MNEAANIVGTIEWTRRTGGRLEPAERRGLIADLARVHAVNVLGRGSAILHLNSGRRAHVSPDRLVAPDSPLTRALSMPAARLRVAARRVHPFSVSTRPGCRRTQGSRA